MAAAREFNMYATQQLGYRNVFVLYDLQTETLDVDSNTLEMDYI